VSAAGGPAAGLEKTMTRDLFSRPGRLMVAVSLMFVSCAASADKVDDMAVALIAKHEGFRAKPYWDRNHWSIGYGTFAASASERSISKSEALRRMRVKVQESKSVVLALVGKKMAPHKTAALVSFAYNMGEDRFLRTSVADLLLARKYHLVPDELRKFVKGKKGKHRVELAGLKIRREAEVALWSKG